MNIIDVPNGSHGGARKKVEGVVLHAMGEWVLSGGDYVHSSNLLQGLGVSAHAIALPDGRIVRQVDSWYVAWHAKGHNARTVGIELALEGTWDFASFENAMVGTRPERYTDEQIEAAAEWCRARSVEHGFPLNAETVRTHSALDPDRKSDPGAIFPYQEFLAGLTA